MRSLSSPIGRHYRTAAKLILFCFRCSPRHSPVIPDPLAVTMTFAPRPCRASSEFRRLQLFDFGAVVVSGFGRTHTVRLKADATQKSAVHLKADATFKSKVLRARN